jgi:hypothetical protein
VAFKDIAEFVPIYEVDTSFVTGRLINNTAEFSSNAMPTLLDRKWNDLKPKSENQPESDE